MRSPSAGSRTNTRARCRLPLEASAAERAVATSAPSPRKISSSSFSLSPFNFTCTQRETNVSRPGVTSWALSRKIVRLGGSSSDLSSAGAEGDAPVVVSSMSSSTTSW
jgi:hypothetical protein